MPYDPVIDPQHAELRVHSSEGSGDIVVGTAKIDLTKLVFNERMEEWYEVVKEDGSVAGHIALGLLKQTESAVEEQANVSPGVIKLTIVGARSLMNADAFGKSDPYVTFQWRGQEFNTEVINDNCDPDWNQDFELPHDPASDPPNLELQVMDTDFATNDDWIGGINVSLLDVRACMHACVLACMRACVVVGIDAVQTAYLTLWLGRPSCSSSRSPCPLEGCPMGGDTHATCCSF
eukprot:GHVU01185534.1.p1 GENE.GHVU01185534.1~~GHVU01185534.1.p1  ORF type:complete len:259 (-),score=52.14 GHVU01185534.1:193-894(-)